MFKPIEGIDYIVDYYAVLGISRDSNKRDIELALRKNRAQWHPDRMQNLSPEILKEAESKNILFSKAREILLNEDFKQAYDKRLSNFEPELVSEDGRAIINISRERIDLDFLLSDKNINFSELVEKAKQLTGYNEKHIKSVELLYNSDKKNRTIKDIYRKELNTELTFISQLEDIAWARVGVTNPKPVKGLLYHSDDYGQQVEIEINRIKEEEIPKGLENRLLACKSGATPLLLGDGKMQGEKDDKISSEIQERIIKNFSNGCDQIREITEKKQQVLEKLVSLTDYEYLVKHNPPTPNCNIFVVDYKKEKIMYGIKFNKEKFSGDTLQEYSEGYPLEKLKKIQPNEDTILVYHNPEIKDILIEVVYVTESLFGE